MRFTRFHSLTTRRRISPSIVTTIEKVYPNLFFKSSDKKIQTFWGKSLNGTFASSRTMRFKSY